MDYTVRRAAPALRSHDLAMAWVAVKQYCMYVQSSNSSFFKCTRRRSVNKKYAKRSNTTCFASAMS